MDSPLPDLRQRNFQNTALALQQSARRGDWFEARACADRLAAMPLPTGALIRDYLQTLEETLLAAKTSHALMTATLRRVRAAAKFESGRILPQ